MRIIAATAGEHCDKSIHRELICGLLQFEQIQTCLSARLRQRDSFWAIITASGRSRLTVRIPEQERKRPRIGVAFQRKERPLRRLDRNGLRQFLRLGPLWEGHSQQALGEGRLDLCLVNILRHLERALERAVTTFGRIVILLLLLGFLLLLALDR